MRVSGRDRNLCGLRATTAGNKREVEEARRRSSLAVGFVRLGKMIGFDRASEDKQLGNQSNCVGLERVGWQRSSGAEGRCFL